MIIGGAIALRSPTAGLAHASGRPVPSWRSVDVTLRCLRSSISVAASMADCASRTVSSSTSVWMPAPMSLRSASVSGP